MIKDTTNLDIINNFLNNFDSKINSLGVYSHYMVYEVDDKDIGFLSYDLIYDRIEIEYIFVCCCSRKNEDRGKCFLCGEAEKRICDDSVSDKE